MGGGWAGPGALLGGEACEAELSFRAFCCPISTADCPLPAPKLPAKPSKAPRARACRLTGSPLQQPKPFAFVCVVHRAKSPHGT